VSHLHLRWVKKQDETWIIHVNQDMFDYFDIISISIISYVYKLPFAAGSLDMLYPKTGVKLLV
jgi:hypothetical protein